MHEQGAKAVADDGDYGIAWSGRSHGARLSGTPSRLQETADARPLDSGPIRHDMLAPWRAS
jgi:hypothetical protein